MLLCYYRGFKNSYEDPVQSVTPPWEIQKRLHRENDILAGPEIH